VSDQLVDSWIRLGKREVGSCRASGHAALTESYWEDVHAVMGLLTTALAPASSGSAAARPMLDRTTSAEESACRA